MVMVMVIYSALVRPVPVPVPVPPILAHLQRASPAVKWTPGRLCLLFMLLAWGVYCMEADDERIEKAAEKWRAWRGRAQSRYAVPQEFVKGPRGGGCGETAMID